MSFTQDAWQRNQSLYQKTLALPFNQELASGTLNKDAFCHYVIQDAHYLEAYGRAWQFVQQRRLVQMKLFCLPSQLRLPLW